MSQVHPTHPGATPEAAISAIIPCHNVENYLDACLASVRAQAEIGEILLIDDASTDATPHIIAQHAAEDPRIQVITFPDNRGVSVARNTGLAHATLPWVWFIDADDLIPQGAAAALLDVAAHDDADIIIGKSQYLHSDGRVTGPDLHFPTRSTSEDRKRWYAQRALDLVRDQGFLGAVWHFIFRTDFLSHNEVRFPPDISAHEDCIFHMRIAATEPAIRWTEAVVYHYRVAAPGGSVIRSYSPDYESDFHAATQECTAARGQLDIPDLRTHYMLTPLNCFINLYRYGCPLSPKERRRKLKQLTCQYRSELINAILHGRISRAYLVVITAAPVAPMIADALLSYRWQE